MHKYEQIFYALFPSKSSCPQGHVGSNPTVSAIKSLKTLGFQGLSLFLNQFSDMPKT